MSRHRAPQIYAVLSDDGICGLHIGACWLPLVFHAADRLPAMRLMAQTVANQTKRPVTIYQFSNGKILETIQPQVK